MEMNFWAGQMTVHAVLVENGTKMIMSNLFDHTSKELEEFYWISREDIDKLIEVKGIYDNPLMKFMVFHVKFNSFLHPNKHSQRIF